MSYNHLSKSGTFLKQLSDYEAIGVSANAFAGPGYDFDVFFDRFVSVSDSQRWPLSPDGNETSASYPLSRSVTDITKSAANIITKKLNEVSIEWSGQKLFDDGAKVVTRQSLSQIEKSTEPFFLFVNYMDSHLPLRPTRGYNPDLYSVPRDWSTADYNQWETIYDPTDEYLIKLRELYGASIEYLDREVSKFIREILDIVPNTTIVITADHGDNLGYSYENELLRHRSSLSEGLLHVPMYIINPSSTCETSGDGYFSHLDLGDLMVNLARETHVDLFRDEIAAEIAGLAQCPDPPKDIEYWERSIRCVYQNRSKYVWDSLGESSIYNLDPERPCWQSAVDKPFGISEFELEWFNAPIGDFKRSAQSQRTEHNVDDSIKDRLEKFGYM